MTSELVQPIALLIDKENPATHEDAIVAAATACVQAYARHSPKGGSWDTWLAGRFTKTVRRAKPKDFGNLVMDQGSFLYTFGTAAAIAFSPMTYDEMPKKLTRLQVSGTDLRPGLEVTPYDSAPIIVLNGSLGMSTGKAAAQAAHALLGYYLKLSFGGQCAWLNEKVPAVVRTVPADQFDELAVNAFGPVITDSGLTEIEPGSRTAFVF